MITEAADLIEKASTLLAPYDADEWSSPAGRRMDLPNRGSVLGIPAEYKKTDDGRIRGVAQFRRFHLGRNGAVHGGCIAQLFDSLLGFTAFRLTRSLYQRTAFLHVDYRAIVPIETELQVDAGVDRVDGRKMFLTGRLLDGEARARRGQRAVRQAEPWAAVSRQKPDLKRRWARWRDRLRERRRAEFVYRIVVGVIGLAVLGRRHPRDPVSRVRAGRSCSLDSASWPPNSTGRGGCWRMPRSATTR